MKLTQPKHEFSQKYDARHAKQYFDKHENGEFWQKRSNTREHQVVRKALKIAGNPKSILDVPCGTGRFWDVLSENPERIIHVTDNSQDMINTGLKYRPQEIIDQIQSSFQGSAFNLPVKDNFVETVVCIRLIHHIGKHEDRLTLLNELQRVCSKTIILSLWVDGNFEGWKRKRRDRRQTKQHYQNRFVIPTKTIEDEFKAVGLEVKDHLDFIPYYSMWRTYILQKNSSNRVLHGHA